MKLNCPTSDRVNLVEGWINNVQADGDRVRIRLSSADRQSFDLLIQRALLEQIAVFGVLNDLRGRFLKVLALQHLWDKQPVVLETPHQLEISP